MQTFEIKLKLILDILKEKKEKLQRLAIITENQGTVLEAKEKTSETVNILTELISEKQRLIDEILGYDDVFLKYYEEIKHELNNENIRRDNRDTILKMQELIIQVNESNEKVIVLERANDSKVEKLKSNIEVAKRNKQNTLNSPISNKLNEQSNSDDMFKPKKAPMTKEYKKTTKAMAKDRTIATVDLQSEIQKSSSKRDSVITGRHETGKGYKFKSMIEQYKNNNRQA